MRNGASRIAADGPTTKHTTNTMMTRRATALCTEQKLRQALEELKHTKETCSQLLRERDESEIEIQKIIARNTQLKSELSQLHAQHVDVLQHQENLNETISCYDQQYSSYERTLQRITDLEKELSVANNQIAHYKELEQLQDTVHTENLYQELVGSPGGLSMLYQPLSTNKDNCPHVNSLNFDNSVQCSVETGNLKFSKNKFKKYVKVRKYILKTRKLINKEKTYYKNVNFIKERTQLFEKLDILNSIIKENRFTYEQNINSLNSRLKNLQQSLTKMTENYNDSKNQIAEYILALKCMSDTSTLVDTPAKSLSPNCSFNENRSVGEYQTYQSVSLDRTINSKSSEQPNHLKYVIICDEIGKDLGWLLQSEFGRDTINYCMPGVTMHQLMTKLDTLQIDINTNLIILVEFRFRMGEGKPFQHTVAWNLKPLRNFTNEFNGTLQQRFGHAQLP
ncbi:hypothetical protein ACJJTC_003225 [Scirpophaga incertulas]